MLSLNTHYTRSLQEISRFTTLAFLLSIALSSCGIGKGGNYGERVANCLVSAKHPDSLFTMPLDSLPGALKIDSAMYYRARNGMEHEVDSIPAPLILGQMECLFGNWYDIPSCALIEQDRHISNIGYPNETSIFVTDLGVDEKGNTVYGGVTHTAQEIQRNTNAYIDLIFKKNDVMEALRTFHARIYSDLIPTEYINNSQELQTSLQKQGFFLDENGERIKIAHEGTSSDGEPRQTFRVASLEHAPNHLKQDILRKLYRKFEIQRDELITQINAMVAEYELHFEGCPYTYNEGTELEELLAFKNRLDDLEREIPAEAIDEVETPENCFSIQGNNLVSSCEGVSGNVIIHSITGSFIKEQMISSNRMNLRDLLSNQASGMYIVTIAFDNKNETLQYINP